MIPRCLLPLLLCAGLVACALFPTTRVTLAPRPIERPVVERLDEKRVRIRWPRSFATDRVTVHGSLDPDEEGPPLGIAQDGSLVLSADNYRYIGTDYRLYYRLVSESGDWTVVAERRLPLQGTDNTRDLGGYQTSDGHTVRWGRVYRATDLSQLTQGDRRYLAGIGLALVCDFRSQHERQRRPDVEIDPALRPRGLRIRRAPEQLALPVDLVDPVEMQTKIRTGGIARLAVEDMMTDAYRDFVVSHSEEWSAMFERLARPSKLPALVHCTGGKDRTGFASAILLLALGVPEETVFEDYLLTNYYQRDFATMVLRWVPIYSFFRTDDQDLLPLLQARRSYLETSLETIAELYGTLDVYLEQALGVDRARRAALRRNLLR